MDSKKNKKIKGQKLNTPELSQAIMKMFRAHPKKQYNAKQIIEKLKINNSKDSVQHALDKLTEKGALAVNKDVKYGFTKIETEEKTNEKTNGKVHEKPVTESLRAKTSDRQVIKGTVDMTRNGSAYIISQETKEDVFITPKNIKNALHGDTVKVQTWLPRGRRRLEGEVIDVIERASDFFIGTIRISKKYAIVLPDRQNMLVDIFVDLEDIKSANDGDKVIVKIIKWHSKLVKSPIGRVTTVLGSGGSSDMEMKSILINQGFNIEFPEEVVAEAEAISTEISTEEIGRRRDMRGITTFTIDPVDAKDFDDAISFRTLDNGNYEIGVHIADVSHYVLPNTPLDKEAFWRATSVYLADRVCPMLPEKLSNVLCSLRPNEDKLTFSAIFEIDEKGKVLERWFGKTVIHSDRRFTYEEAQNIIETGEGDYAKEILILDTIAKALRKKRFKNGSIDFDSEEVRFRLDENAVPVEVYVKVQKDSNKLIEDFMLLANKEVATYINKKVKPEIPFVYRVHDLPNDEKLFEFARFAAELGFNFDFSTPKSIAASFNRISKAAKENEVLKTLAPIAIRTMAKAEYSTDNIGHYGLAFENYSHFTSPIRRYADVLAHRILFQNLKTKVVRWEKDKLEEACQHISKQERKATDAERESTKYKQVEFMKSRIGETFEGVISGVLDRGIFVETIYGKCEGLVGFDRMSEAFEVFNGRLQAKGLRTGRSFKLGDVIKIKIIGADLSKRQIEMDLAD
jgi:ribonuclease R